MDSRKKGGIANVCEKKWLTGLVVLLVMIVVVTTSGSLGVFAESDVVTQPMEMAKTIEVELNDDYFSPKSHHYFQWRNDNVDIEKKQR
ncbi:hypothetical protein GCM10020331_056430 [Ectobacillus funiculus]